jgi:hypothetical protein
MAWYSAKPRDNLPYLTEKKYSGRKQKKERTLVKRKLSNPPSGIET